MARIRDRVGDVWRTVREFFQDQWFDRTRRVRTSGNVTLQTAGLAENQIGDSTMYQPARPAHIRQALRQIPGKDMSAYSYVDLGSGKGRTLFVAAELPFRQIIGVEFTEALHAQACANIRSFRRRRSGGPIASLHLNAKEFVFPDGPIVLYMFNPFGAATMAEVLGNLERSLERAPRHVIVVLLWPKCEEQVARVPGMRLRHRTERLQIFETGS
ncbi:MAG TPA: hypothetical protein VM865_03745 [Acidobacteriaceae bacterium]|jgi:hypothetical protein|nr:hypothetical protein [Acidobacteriaceae bacterium]